MNIFFSSDCPKECAQYLDDKRVNKMILESAQMLATAVQIHGGNATYKPTHKNHPSTIWARHTRSNYMWLLSHFKELYSEKVKRTGKGHKTFELYFKELEEGAKHIPEGDLTEFANCAANDSVGISYKFERNVKLAYKKYLYERWLRDKKQPTWGGNKENPMLTYYENDYLNDKHKGA